MAPFAPSGLVARVHVEHLDDEVVHTPAVPHPAVWGTGGAMVGFAVGQLIAYGTQGHPQTLSLLGALVAALFFAWIAHGVATSLLAAHRARLDALDRAARLLPVDAMAVRMVRMAIPSLQAMILAKPDFFATEDTWLCSMSWRPDSHRMEPRFRYDSAVFRLQRAQQPRHGFATMSINLGTVDPSPRSPVPMPRHKGRDAGDWDVFCMANPVVHVSLAGLRIGTSKHALLSLIARLEAFVHATEARALANAEEATDGNVQTPLPHDRAHTDHLTPATAQGATGTTPAPTPIAA